MTASNIYKTDNCSSLSVFDSFHTITKEYVRFYHKSFEGYKYQSALQQAHLISPLILKDRNSEIKQFMCGFSDSIT